MLTSSQNKFTIDSNIKTAPYKISSHLLCLLDNNVIENSNIIILCIGTDRSTGDSLGPLVGQKLSSYYKLKNAKVFGTLLNPIHAKNITENKNLIYNTYTNPFIIAIDAALGCIENIGKINIQKGPLYPGAGVNKNIPSIGDISITGIVNLSGYMEFAMLQSTRLSLVMSMADTIALSIYMCMKRIEFSNISVNQF
jgi:putative sporulation protein YyaC